MDRTERLKLLYAMFELNLKRELTHEERRLLALSESFYGKEPAQEDEHSAARGESA